jgi:hypothetical protein
MSRTFFFSGIEKAATADALAHEGAAGMISRLQYSANLMEACGSIPLVMDCGAFTRPLSRQDIEQYAKLIVLLGDRCEWYAAPDKIGDQHQSNENYTFLLSLLPIELHHRVLWIYQQSAPVKSLLQGLEQHSRIGIGGLVPLLEDRDRAYHIIAGLANIVSAYPVQPHYFGVTSCAIIKMLASVHEDFSVDSTTWLIGAKYGRVVNSAGQQRPACDGGFDWPKDALLRQNIRTMRKWVECPEKRSTVGHIQLSFEEMSA